MSGTNRTTITKQLMNWANDNPSDLIFVLCVVGGIVLIFCILFGICLCSIAKKTIIYEQIVNTRTTKTAEENGKA